MLPLFPLITKDETLPGAYSVMELLHIISKPSDRVIDTFAAVTIFNLPIRKDFRFEKEYHQPLNKVQPYQKGPILSAIGSSFDDHLQPRLSQKSGLGFALPGVQL